mgnify:CR=1 FL=1
MSEHDFVPGPPRTVEELKAQKKRNIWIAIALITFVVLVGTTTALRLGASDMGKDGGMYWRMPDSSTSSKPLPADAPPMEPSR